MNNNDLANIIQEAEAAAASVKDVTLKEKAFEVILSSLLNSASVRKKGGGLPRLKGAVKRQVIHASKIEKKKSVLKFDVDQLEHLKAFYDTHKPKGREMCVFVLAMFLKKKANKELFHEGDIEYAYTQLVNLRTKEVPPAMDSEQIRQSLYLLIAPSRKKQWIEAREDGQYGVSAGGVLMYKGLEYTNEA